MNAVRQAEYRQVKCGNTTQTFFVYIEISRQTCIDRTVRLQINQSFDTEDTLSSIHEYCNNIAHGFSQRENVVT